MLRYLVRGRLATVWAVFEVQRTESHVVLHVPGGAEGATRSGPRGGPRGRLLLPGNLRYGFVPRPWTGNDVLMVHRFDQPWSTWRWLDADGAWLPGSYVNLERLWVLGDDGYDTEDLTLDLVIAGDGSLSFKDEDEVDWCEAEGVYSPTEAADIRAIGQRAADHFSRAGWPLGVSWDGWAPARRSSPPRLPDGWDGRPPPAP